MIVHEYGEWHEPEQPPFTVEDVIKAIQEMMLKAHVSFDEAMRMLLARGLPFNAFLQVNGLDALLEELIGKLEALKEQMRQQYDMDGLLEREQERIERLRDDITRKVGRKKENRLLDALRSLLGRPRPSRADLQKMLSLGWQMEGPDEIEKLVDRLQGLGPLQAFAERERFRGEEALDVREARRVRERFEAIDKLEADLREALEQGNLLQIDADQVRKMLGEEAAQALDAKREELFGKFNEALEQTGMVDTDDGIYKLTPAAARKLGNAFLMQVFSLLKTDGLGKHAATYTGEGQVESVKTRAYEFGDSIAHLDMPSSLMNAVIREGTGLPIRVKASDFEVHETMGTARTAIAVLIDMSGSMARYGRFYNAKKVALALDALVRAQFPEDRIYFIGFATFARQYRVGDIPALAPKPVTHFGSSIQLTLDFEALADPRRKGQVPQYFTNTQKGLEMARRLLSREESANRHIIMITDGVPTAYYLGTRLKLTYPPRHETFHETLREVRACTDTGITINTFMMTSEWEFDYHGEREFVEAVARINNGRIFYPSPDSLTQYVLVDYMQHKKQLFAL
jgi:uncharacterized protein with von Willebrand factor type A (vWA) domain